jgi:uncharacterized protein (TIGR03437 family)
MVTLRDADFSGDGKEFGPFSPSSFVTIRQRLNMNAVRLPVNAELYRGSAAYRARVSQAVRIANHFELLTILTADRENDFAFWADCSARFKNNPNVFFAPAGQERQRLADAIRSSGAHQPVVLGGPVRDTNVVLEVTPSYVTSRTEADRWRQFGSLAERSPVLVNGFDPELDRDTEECAAFPGDPAEAARLVEDNLTYFDTHEISWTLSSFRPGRMISEYRFYNWSKLDDGWVCGESPSRGGIALLLLAHLWSGEPRGLFSVNPPTGGIAIARGALSTAYGPILGEREMSAPGRPLPLRLGNMTVRVTDSRGVARRAGLLYTGAGWANLTFAVPAETALGPAEVALVRTDGSISSTHVIVVKVAPGFWTATADGRGPVIGRVTQRFANGGTKAFPAWECAPDVYVCRTVPIVLSERVTTTVRLDASGIRNADRKAAMRVSIGDVPVQVLSFGAGDDVGRDQVTIKLPARLPGAGETDITMTVDGLLSNVARIDIAGGIVVPKGFPQPPVPADTHQAPGRCRQVQGAHVAQHRADCAVHARWQHRDAGGGGRSLRGGGPYHRRRAVCGRRPR